MNPQDPPPVKQEDAQPQVPQDVNDLRQRLQDLEHRDEALCRELEEARQGPNRKLLPPTRQSLTHKFTIDQHKGYITVGLYEDKTPGEVFLTMAKEGSTIGGLMDAVGILTSLALQYGVPVDALARKFEYVSFEPSGWTGNPTMRRASSVTIQRVRDTAPSSVTSIAKRNLPCLRPWTIRPAPHLTRKYHEN